MSLQSNNTHEREEQGAGAEDRDANQKEMMDSDRKEEDSEGETGSD